MHYHVHPRQPDEALIQAAEKQAERMAMYNTITHGPDTAGERAHRFGYPSTYVFENVAYGNETPQDIFKMWMDSPGHYENIISQTDDIGIGIAESESGTLFWCVVFGRK